MAKKIHKFGGFTVGTANVQIDLNLDRLSDQFNKAQFALDSMVMTSMEPFMPKDDGSFIEKTKSESASMAGTGQVCAGKGDEARFLYEGKVMVDEKTGSPFASAGAKKVIVSQYAGKTKAKENIVYSTHKNPKAQPHWFDAAKSADGDNWIRTTKKIAGGG